MYLKGITMQGFKSFADKIELKFGKGITAIVGPNGSGKSNVSDAIRWVMGEQSAKTLRGSKMEDVIFSGTQNRKPMGFAEVSIILDNTDKSLNLDFDEVVVTRRVHRSGESEYLINQSACRLKDVHELFMDTGIGREGYSVVGQGKIDEILSSKSEDRRHIFEEAAGISKYKYRKNEAEKKLLQTEENLVRIRDILSELEAQVGPLETQSKKARQFLDLREKLKVLEVNIALIHIEKYRAASKKSEEALKIALEQLEQSKGEVAALEKTLQDAQDANVRQNEAVNALKAEQFNLEKDKGSQTSQIAIYQNDIANHTQNAARLLEEIESLHKKAEQNAGQRKQEQANIQSLLETLGALEAQVRADEAQIDTRNKAHQQAVLQIEEKKAALIELLNALSSDKANAESLDVLQQNFFARSSTIQDEISKNQAEQDKLAAEIDALKQALFDADKQKEAHKQAFEALKQEYFQITADSDRLKAEQNSRTAEFNQKQSRLLALEDLERSYEGYSRSVKEILNRKLPGVRGVISKLLSVEERYVAAIETAMGRALQNIVVDSEEDAKACIAMLKKANSGRATFLPRTAIKGQRLANPPQNEPGYVGLADSLVTFDPQYENIFQYLLGKTVIVDTIDHAIAISKKYGYRFKIVTLDGQVLNPGGSMTGGSLDRRSGLISRAKEIERLKRETSALSKEMDRCDAAIHKHSDTIRRISDDKEAIEAAIHTARNEIVRLTAEAGHKEELLASAKKSSAMLSGEQGGIGKEISELVARKEALSKTIAQCEADIFALREAINQMQAGEAEMGETIRSLESACTEKKMRKNTVQKDIEVANSRILALDSEKSAFLSEIALKTETQKAEVLKNEELNHKILQIKANMQDFAGRFSELEQQIADGQAAYTAGIASIKELQKQLSDKQETVFLLGQEVTRCENKAAKLTADTEAVINRLWEDYEITFSDAAAYRADIGELSGAVKEANALKREIKALGNINLDAIEEYKSVKERYTFLSGQESDLNGAKQKLGGIITEMQEIMKSRFIERFELIRTEFNNVFCELFGGGIAKLYFADEGNILESGIEIEVQPPGKRLQNLTLLSGGERAFAAIALLFAVLKTAPTPFCLLDEVEAALDEVNVYKFADYVRRYSDKTQFLIVTHRRGTMESADIMYGVTMQEKGVSKLLKLDFKDLEEQYV